MNVATLVLSLLTVKVAFGSGAELGSSDPALTGPGRIGLTVMTPFIPVDAVPFDWPRAAHANATKSVKIIRTIRKLIVLDLVFQTSGHRQIVCLEHGRYFASSQMSATADAQETNSATVMSFG